MIQPKIRINKKRKEARKEKIVMAFIYIVIALTLVIIFFTVKITFFPETSDDKITASAMQVPTTGRMSLTSYDKELARKFMDKNNDGECDACGMPVEICMDSGQLQCNMDSKSTIGVLGSQHIHADWKVYVNGEALDFTGKDHMTRMRSGSSVSSFIHVDSGAQEPEKTGDILHMHATGVPLWIFFDSIELNLPESTKVYVNGQLNLQGLNYVFNDLDKILISYGNETNLESQIEAITNFAKNH